MISVCIITKNEADKLDICLDALYDAPAELVVVDTGSSDNTIEVAKKYTDKVYSFEWCNDFSAARNFAAEKAANDVILMVDTDEYLTKADWSVVSRFARNSESVGRITRTNIYTRGGEVQRSKDVVSRLYNRKVCHYEGIIHEQIVRKDGANYQPQELPLYFDHVGYDGSDEAVAAKADRNIELLLAEYAKNDSDVYTFYQLGKSYYMKKDYERAFYWLDLATYQELDERLEYVEDLIVSYGYAMLNTKRAEQAMGLCELAENFPESADFFFMLGLVYMNNEFFEKAIETFESATHKKNALAEGVNSYKAFYNIGVIYECLGNTKEARQHYMKAQEYDKARERLSRLESL